MTRYWPMSARNRKMAGSSMPEKDVPLMSFPLILAVFFAFAFVVAALDQIFRPVDPNNPKLVLRRCRASLWEIRKELESLPANREVHEVYEQCARTERTINQVEAEIGR